jgi:hypothetical protein
VGLSSSKKTALERRLKELQKESELVRGDIKLLNRVVKNPGGFARIPKLRSEREAKPIPPPVREDPVSREPAEAPEPPAGPHDDLFGFVPKPELGRSGGRPPAAADAGAGARSKVVSKDERFANYFSSGGFLGGPRPLKQERNVQRNKAVFMIVVVIVVCLWVFYLVFK